MRSIKPIKKMSFDKLPKPYWIIQEIVTPQGHTIDWSGIYATKEATLKAIAEETKRG